MDMTSYKQRVHYHNLFNVLRDIKNCQLFSQTEYQETLLDIITTTIKRIRRYQSSKVIDLARLVKLLYGIQKHDSIQIKYNGKTQFDFPYGETTRLENPV